MIKRTRFFTANYITFHRRKDCSYLKTSARVFSFLAYEPIEEYIVYDNKIILQPCSRCGK